MQMNMLEAFYRERAKASPEQSYTRQLLDGGTKKCAKKFGEEATEVVIAAVAESDERFIAECADAVYHLDVLLISRNLSFEHVQAELVRRMEKSGVQEKASRQS